MVRRVQVKQGLAAPGGNPFAANKVLIRGVTHRDSSKTDRSGRAAQCPFTPTGQTSEFTASMDVSLDRSKLTLFTLGPLEPGAQPF
jgi:hypothetical protein